MSCSSTDTKQMEISGACPQSIPFHTLEATVPSQPDCLAHFLGSCWRMPSMQGLTNYTGSNASELGDAAATATW